MKAPLLSIPLFLLFSLTASRLITNPQPSHINIFDPTSPQPTTIINNLSPQQAQSATHMKGYGEHQVHAGYVEIRDKTAMFWVYYKARNGGGDDAPLILWLQGGPGCSSFTGDFYEIGPYQLVQGDAGWELDEREINWNEEYNLLFVDNPVGVGYSYVASEKDLVTTEDQMAQDLYKGLAEWFKAFPQHKQNDFYIFGESYAGKYIPAISEYILKQDSKDVPLSAIGIGDGLTNPQYQVPLYGDFAFNNGLIDGATLSKVEQSVTKFIQALKHMEWTAANNATGEMQETIIKAAGGINVYNFRKFDNYPDNLSEVLNDPIVKSAYGVPAFVKFESCSGAVGQAMVNDMMRSVADRVEYVVDRIPVLLYNGQNDFIINTPGADAWIERMNWSDARKFNQTPRTAWKNKQTGTPAGYYRSVGNLSQAVIINSGHMVPRDQPESAKEMLDGFITHIQAKKKTSMSV